jgi:2-oxoglutarate dehydrogenase E2 component (dihydrolipoamide succinyltransferase)
MPIPVLMPQMGESIVEGTIVRWIKKVGDRVERDEPLFEISTDKVEAEIPSPAAGILAEITAQEGQTVPVDTVVGTIRQPGETVDAPAAAVAAPAGPPAVEAPVEPTGPPSVARAAASWPSGSGAPEGAPSPRRRTSPLVRRIARERGIDLSRLSGSGLGGRVTKHDVLEHLERAEPTAAPGAGQGEPLSAMRRKIAEHMVLSRRTAAHVHTVFHVDFSAIAAIRRERRADYEDAGLSLTYLVFVARAVADALGEHPIINASLDGDRVVYKSEINLGIAVALDSGLIVPVVRRADQLDMRGLSRAIADAAGRARTKQLKPEEVHGGTFTITNPGHLGAQFGLPIINQPQSAILDVGAIEKRPVVVADEIAIRTMAYLALGFDHRLIDGAVADAFMANVKRRLEQFDPAIV